MDFKKMNEAELKQALAFTKKLAQQQTKQKMDFSAMETTPESLAEVENYSREYIRRRKAGLNSTCNFGVSEDEQAEIDEITKNIREYYKRTRKVVNG